MTANYITNRCGRCAAGWTGTQKAHCGACHITFSSINTFDRHRVHGMCRTPDDSGLHWYAEREVWGFPPREEGSGAPGTETTHPATTDTIRAT